MYCIVLVDTIGLCIKLTPNLTNHISNDCTACCQVTASHIWARWTSRPWSCGATKEAGPFLSDGGRDSVLSSLLLLLLLVVVVVVWTLFVVWILPWLLLLFCCHVASASGPVRSFPWLSTRNLLNCDLSSSCRCCGRGWPWASVHI